MKLEHQLTREEAYIPKYERLYVVSNFGEIYSERRKGTKGKMLVYANEKGYLYVGLSKNNKRKKIGVHRVVALSFIPNPHNKPQVNHKDGNKLNNNVTNLEWATRKENEDHKRNVLGKDGKGNKNGNYGYRKSKLYPCGKIRNRLCELGVPRCKHDLAELGELLPQRIKEHKDLCCVKDDQVWWVGYDGKTLADEVAATGKTEADSRGRLLIHLLENKLL